MKHQVGLQTHNRAAQLCWFHRPHDLTVSKTGDVELVNEFARYLSRGPIESPALLFANDQRRDCTYTQQAAVRRLPFEAMPSAHQPCYLGVYAVATSRLIVEQETGMI